MTDLREALRGLAAAEPETTRIDPSSAVATSRARRRTAHRPWLAAAALAGVVVASGTVAVQVRRAEHVDPSATPGPSASAEPLVVDGADLGAVAVLLRSWGYTVGDWTVQDGGYLWPMGAEAGLGASGGSVQVSTGPGSAPAGTDAGCTTADCAPTAGIGGGSTDVRRQSEETVVLSADSSYASVTRQYTSTGVWSRIVLTVVRAGSLSSQPTDPYVTLGRLDQLADALGMPPTTVEDVETHAGIPAQLTGPQQTSTPAFFLVDGVSYDLTTACVPDVGERLASPLRFADGGGAVLPGDVRCDGQSHSRTLVWSQGRRALELRLPASGRAYVTLVPSPVP